MKNFSVNIDGKKYWISRSIAVAAFIFTKDIDNDLCILANKRGSGTPDFQGYWNCPCGYLDYNETLEEAVKREVFEETGVVCSKDIIFIDVDSDPQSNKQNVTVRYTQFIDNPIIKERIGGEKNEVEDIQWVKTKDINNYKWAFNHDKRILDIVSAYYTYYDLL